MSMTLEVVDKGIRLLAKEFIWDVFEGWGVQCLTTKSNGRLRLGNCDHCSVHVVLNLANLHLPMCLLSNVQPTLIKHLPSGLSVF